MLVDVRVSEVVLIGAKINVWQKIVQDLVVAVNAILWQHHKRRQSLGGFSVVAVVKAKGALADKVELCHLDPTLADHLASVLSPIPAGEKPNDCLVDKSLLARIEEVSEVSSEVLEKKLDQLGLVLWRQLLEELVVFHKHVEIVGEGVFDEEVDIPVHSRGHRDVT